MKLHSLFIYVAHKLLEAAAIIHLIFSAIGEDNEWKKYATDNTHTYNTHTDNTHMDNTHMESSLCLKTLSIDPGLI